MRRMATLGAEIVGGTPDQLTTHIAAELKRWSTVIKKSGIGVRK